MTPQSFPPSPALPALPAALQPHRRTILRDHIAALLISRTLAGRHVYRSRVSPLGDDVAASLVVFTASENCRQITNSPTDYNVTQTLVIEARVLAAEGDYQGRFDGDDELENWDAALDRLCAQVETAVFLDPFLATHTTIASVNTRTGFAGGGEFVPGVAVISVDLEYVWQAPGIDGDDLTDVRLLVDVVDPAADPNRLARFTPARRQGPDGRVEVEADALERKR